MFSHCFPFFPSLFLFLLACFNSISFPWQKPSKVDMHVRDKNDDSRRLPLLLSVSYWRERGDMYFGFQWCQLHATRKGQTDHIKALKEGIPKPKNRTENRTNCFILSGGFLVQIIMRKLFKYNFCNDSIMLNIIFIYYS